VKLVWQFYCVVCNRKCQAGGVVLIDLFCGSQTLVVLAAKIGKSEKIALEWEFRSLSLVSGLIENKRRFQQPLTKLKGLINSIVPSSFFIRFYSHKNQYIMLFKYTALCPVWSILSRFLPFQFHQNS
jgi:hypothetical protein